jgi:multiple sugar transport system substrate-binding protein
MASPLSRRRVLTGLAAAGLAPVARARPARAVPVTLKIAQWSHFVPEFDAWFDKKFTREWGEKNGVQVIVDHYSLSELRARAQTEVAARHGHDLFAFYDGAPSFEEHVLPLNDVVADCERRFGKLAPIVHRSTFNPRTQRYFAFSDAWAPDPIHYRTDWWGEAGVRPESWDLVREGARRIKEKHGMIAGFGLAPEPDSNMVLRGLLWSFGAAEQDEAGRVTLDSGGTVEAIKLMTAIYRESMNGDVFMWDPSSNNRAFVWGRASIIQNAISAMRTAEKQNPDLARRAALGAPPAGPATRLAAPHFLHSYVIWKFAESAELARRFLVDLVAGYEAAFAASEAYNLPSFSRAVPDLARRLASDRDAGGRYALLADAGTWTVNPGHPGYLTAPIEEVTQRSILPRMFARAARGEASPEDAARQADAEMKRIFARWAR